MLRKLLSHPLPSRAADVLSLEEMLLEGASDTLRERHSRVDRLRAGVQQVRRVRSAREPG